MLRKELSHQYLRRAISREEFWGMYIKDNQLFDGYLFHLYKKALEEKSADTMFEAIFISDFLATEPMDDAFIDTIVACLAARWHQQHEDLVHYYKGFFREQDIPVLIDLVHFEPEYLAWDESRQLARKSLYALEKINTESAFSAIEALKSSADETIAYYAKEIVDSKFR